MANSISNWYHNQYAAWNRTRRMQASPFVARAESQAARITRTASGGGETVINMGDLIPNNEGERPQTTEKKKQDTLFGPSIGMVDAGPLWANETVSSSEKQPIQDVLTPDLVKNWVEKAKEGSQPTTTLQALVNLKRPTLRLSPIIHDEPEDVDSSQPHYHGLEFQFDCDAPKCGISLHAMPPPSKNGSASSQKLINIFNMVVEGGFGRVLKLEEGAMLELDKYDPIMPSPPSETPASEPSNQPSEGPASSSSDVAITTPEPANEPHHKKRFTLRIRKRTHPHAAEESHQVSVAGPALQVVDMEAPHGDGDKVKHKEEGGVKVLIKLEALDEHDHSLASPNSQITYLHIVRMGTVPTPPAPDTRPWVVRVVKREATIGPHTFHLHEIYGLTSHTSAHPADGHQHTYPPTVTHTEDDPTSECLLCLSSPREVVLLPCRHLVACRECAMNMIEFGAGGQVTHNEEPAPATTGATDAAGGDATATGEASGTGGDAAPPTPAPAPPRTRRKRKPKGWFCPVCRQPYTSMLRISTTAPVKKDDEAAVTAPTTPTPTTTATPQRSGFLAAISNAVGGNANSETNANPPVGANAV
ncbi:hypothetical protein M422DRAFT_260663 [Sphaerobolus stellatus SS14]|uniref:Unplaced genomic scaffold SPHSTscaffold_98, whole genome shotgun sequence n=1 Tax=Sphaerobolus stellatus (strain SS14) TaxID=990650 RepID=A0A0C9VIB5_SPHS4|nr:hypothetical protein M422DRAFT_260663 [Sphaerobolus stellatus SS14]